MDEQLRAFLDTDILLGYYGGDEEIARLFDPSMLQKTHYSISPIVIQELILRLDESNKRWVDLDKLTRMVEVVSNKDMIDETNRSTELEFLRSTDTKLHVNDYLNLFAARRNHCDFFVTNDEKLLSLDRIKALRLVTPHAFLQMEAVA
jgi:predicted nucleic acid-binding protein